MSFWKHMFRGYLISLIPFMAAFLISAFTPWDIFDSEYFGDAILYIIPLFGLVWIVYYFYKYRPIAAPSSDPS
jgi:hypothetical protein